MILVKAAKLCLIVSFILSLFVSENCSTVFRGLHLPDEGSDKVAEDVKIPVVTIKQGIIEGKVDVSRNGREFLSFTGIPFGKVPRRFDNALPTNGWNGTRDATEYGPACSQIHIFSHKYSGVEDCLSLNVFVPKVNNISQNGLPVMFTIYGGAFVMGSSETNQPHYLMDEDVIVVSANYRLSAFGFLNAGIKGASGNQGLKDLVLALKWVQQNIKTFGGDPALVTIFGISAGGAAVSHFVASPMASGLFSGAIAQSGASTIGWAQWPDPEFEEPKKLAIALDCPTSNKEFMVECLRKIKPEVLARATDFKDSVWFERSATPVFAPSIETYKESENDSNVFQAESAELVIEEGRANNVPLMIGFVSHEGFALHAGPILLQPDKTKLLNERWGRILPEALFYWSIAKDPCKVSSKLRQLYFQDKLVGFGTATGLEQLYTHGAFVYPVRKVAMKHAQFNPVYMYNFTREVKASFVDLYQFWDVYNPGTALKLPTHGDDGQFIYSRTRIFPEIPKDHPDHEFSMNMVKLWASFAKNGKPTHTWGSKIQGKIEPLKATQANDEKVTYINIDNELSIQPESEEIYQKMKMLDDICKNDFDYCMPLNMK